MTGQSRVEMYSKQIIMITLANERGLTPSEISEQEINEAYENNSLTNYRLIQEPIKSFENGIERHSVVVALVDRETGYHYNSNVIEIR